jgi:hypothetical protein
MPNYSAFGKRNDFGASPRRPLQRSEPLIGGLFGEPSRLWALHAILRQLRYGAGHWMTLHDTFFSANPYFLSFPVF